MVSVHVMVHGAKHPYVVAHNDAVTMVDMPGATPKKARMSPYPTLPHTASSTYQK